jgi:sodium-dependent dicarboxylate transporter 2/3/5
MFATGMLRKEHLRKIDWSTLLLIAGGITLGRLLERSGTISMLTSQMQFSELDPTIALFAICLISALFSALMSNTATVVMLIPIATALIPEPSTAILVAISASFGIPFVISTPQNAMAYGEGGLRTSDLFYPGIVIMVLGCLIVSLTGRYVLGLVGIQ